MKLVGPGTLRTTGNFDGSWRHTWRTENQRRFYHSTLRFHNECKRKPFENWDFACLTSVITGSERENTSNSTKRGVSTYQTLWTQNLDAKAVILSIPPNMDPWTMWGRGWEHSEAWSRQATTSVKWDLVHTMYTHTYIYVPSGYLT